MRAFAFALAAVLASAPVAAAVVMLPSGTSLTLVTIDDLSSKAQQTGDPIRLKVRDTVRVNGSVVIPADTPVVGQVVEARGTGALAVNGKLLIAPLYLQIGGETVRLTGAELAQGSTKVDAVAGLLVTGLISGRSAKIPAGSLIGARTIRDIPLPIVTPAAP